MRHTKDCLNSCKSCNCALIFKQKEINNQDCRYLKLVKEINFLSKLVHIEDSIEVLLTIFSTTKEITQSRNIEILEIILQLLKCKKICLDNKLM